MIVLFLLRHQEARRLNTILEAYKIGSGQLVNRAKSDISLSRNYLAEAETKVTQCLNIEREALEEKYLGLPTAIGRSILREPLKKYVQEFRTLLYAWCERSYRCSWQRNPHQSSGTISAHILNELFSAIKDTV